MSEVSVASLMGFLSTIITSQWAKTSAEKRRLKPEKTGEQSQKNKPGHWSSLKEWTLKLHGSSITGFNHYFTLFYLQDTVGRKCDWSRGHMFVCFRREENLCDISQHVTGVTVIMKPKVKLPPTFSLAVLHRRIKWLQLAVLNTIQFTSYDSAGNQNLSVSVSELHICSGSHTHMQPYNQRTESSS